MPRVRFSIATPTRNSLDKLKRCVGSVRGQSEVPHEHIVQDARSADGTPAWLAGQTDLLAQSEPDSGMYDAINRAWARSDGEFLSWLNSDEQYLPGTLAKVGSFFDSHPNVGIVFGDYIVADALGRPVALRREIPFRRAYVVNGFLNMQSATIFYRRSLLDRGLLQLSSHYRYAADKELILRLADAGVEIARVPSYLSIFGVDGTNLSTHAMAATETEHIKREFGALRSGALRSAVMLGRRAERLFNGGYRSAKITYQYAIDETPRYETVTSGSLGGRYSLASAHRRNGAEGSH